MYLASDEMLHCHQPRPSVMERRWNSKVEIAPNCPRCASSNTKFCYYNNYSQSQPRYFCKGCRRYWTKGGSLRNVPAGGGCRKSRRTKPVQLMPCDGSSVCDDDRSHGTELATSDPSVEGSSGDPSKPDIDLAAVFAKFVNRTEETNTYSDLYGSTNQNTPQNDKFFDLQTQSSTREDGAQFFSGSGEEFPSGDYIVQGQAREFTGHDLNSFAMQNMLSDELAQDPMWSDSTTLTNLSWQLQELGSYCDGQTKFSSTGYENWSIFDLPTYDIFPKP